MDPHYAAPAQNNAAGHTPNAPLQIARRDARRGTCSLKLMRRFTASGKAPPEAAGGPLNIVESHDITLTTGSM